VPFIGRIGEYLRLWKNPMTNQNSINNGSFFNNIVNPSGFPGQPGQGSIIPGHSSIIPPGPFSLANLINNSPLDMIKESQLLDIGD
jgi:hypothetical protein